MNNKRKRSADDALQCSGNGCDTSQRVDEHTVRKKIANMIILHNYPLSIVNHVGFQDFSRSLNPHFNMVSECQVRKDIDISFKSERSMRQRVLQSTVDRIAVSMDLWTSHDKTRQFVAATAHFIDDSWTLQSFLFEFRNLQFGYTEEMPMETYLECLYSWCIHEKLSTLTYDDCFDKKFIKETYSTSLNLKALILGGKFLRMRCFALTLKSLVGIGLETLGDASIKIQDSVDYWTAKPQRHNKLLYLAFRLGVKSRKKLVQYCETQWESMYLMLESALRLRDVFKLEELRVSDPEYTSIPSEEDWNLTQEVCGMLKMFYEAARLFSGKKYRTANEYFQKVCEVKLALSEWAASENEVVRDMASKMVEKFDEYWTEVNSLLAVAAVLDPRYRMYIVEFYFSKIYKDGAQPEIDRVRNICSQLFIEYHTRLRLRLDKGSKHVKSTLCAKEEDPMSAFDSFVAERKKKKNNDTVITELAYYLNEDVLPRNDDFNVLSWWKANGVKYPTLQMIARDILAIPGSKVVSDAAFCTADDEEPDYE